jgi:hypothetical protein
LLLLLLHWLALMINFALDKAVSDISEVSSA